MRRNEWAGWIVGVTILIILITCAVAATTTQTTNDRDREQACNSAGGQILRDLGPGMEEGCYSVSVQYETIAPPEWR